MFIIVLHKLKLFKVSMDVYKKDNFDLQTKTLNNFTI
jgi:hypothetical protein